MDMVVSLIETNQRGGKGCEGMIYYEQRKRRIIIIPQFQFVWIDWFGRCHNLITIDTYSIHDDNVLITDRSIVAISWSQITKWFSSSLVNTHACMFLMSNLPLTSLNWNCGMMMLHYFLTSSIVWFMWFYVPQEQSPIVAHVPLLVVSMKCHVQVPFEFVSLNVW